MKDWLKLIGEEKLEKDIDRKLDENSEFGHKAPPRKAVGEIQPHIPLV